MVVLFDMFHMPEDVFDVVFATEQQALVAKMLINQMKSTDGMMGKTEMSVFATQLHDGVVVEVEKGEGMFKKKEKTKVSYNKRQFYDRILTPMKGMGMIDYDMYKKQYIISDKFNKAMYKIGLMWIQHIQRK